MKFKVGDRVVWAVPKANICDLCEIIKCDVMIDIYKVQIIRASVEGLEGRTFYAPWHDLRKCNTWIDRRYLRGMRAPEI